MKLFVTGANGYIGSNLIEKFKRNESYDIVGHSRSICDLTDLPALTNTFAGYYPDVVIHTAAKANSVEYQNAQDVLTNNIVSTQNIIQTFPNAFHIFFSSIVVYRTAGNIRKTTSAVKPRSIYGVSKLACEHLYNAARIISNTKSCFIRPCAVVGGQNYTHGLINAILKKVNDNPRQIELFGKNPGAIKPYVHIDDLYKRVNYYVSHQYNNIIDVVATKDPLSVLDVAKLVFSNLGVNPEIKWNPKGVWKGDNKLIKYQDHYSFYNLIYKTSTEAIQNMYNEVY